MKGYTLGLRVSPKLYKISLFLLFAVLTGCDNDSADGNFMDGVKESFTLEDLGQAIPLKSKKLDLGIVLGPVNLFTHDSLLFISSTGRDVNLGVYNKNQEYKQLNDIIIAGQGPDEMLSVYRMFFEKDGSFWAHDIVAMNMKKFDLTLNQDTAYATMKEMVTFEVPSVTEAVPLSNGTIPTTTHDINPLKRFYVYDFNGKKIGTPSDYPTYERKIPNTATVEVYSGHMVAHPEGNKFIMAYDYTDLIEIYDQSSVLQKRVQGPHLFKPDFELRQRGEYYFMRRLLGRTRQAYIKAVANSEHVMLLYANGRPRLEGEGEAGIHHNHIVMIDWNGKPVKMYELDHAVSDFAVDWENSVIYGLDRIESEVYAFSF